jgi:3-methyladenine DNA glycosylase AlkD
MATRKPKIDGDPIEIIDHLRSLGNQEGREGMMRFGIRPQTELLGISVTTLRSIAKTYKTDHDLALALCDIHEARILAGIVDDPDVVTIEQMDAWSNDFDSWDICDQTCQNLFQYTLFAEQKAYEWVQESNEFVKRAGFVIMAESAVSGNVVDDKRFYSFLPTLVDNMTDERNFVKKSVSWAFRQIGKRNTTMQKAVLDIVQPLLNDENQTTRWIAKDVYKDLTDPKTRKRIKD